MEKMEKHFENYVSSKRFDSLLFFDPLLHYPTSFNHLFLFPEATFVFCFVLNKKLSEEQYESLFPKLCELYKLKDFERGGYRTAHLKKWFLKLINSLKDENFGRKFPEIFPKFLEFELKYEKLTEKQMEEIFWGSVNNYPHILKYSDEMGLFALKHEFYVGTQYWDEGPCVQEFVGPRYEEFVREIFDAGGECICCTHGSSNDDNVDDCPLNVDGLSQARGFVLAMKLEVIKREYL